MSDTDYLNQIEKLVELQKVDDEIFSVKQEQDNAPLALDDLRRRFEIVDSRRNHTLDKIAHMDEQRKRLSLELDEDEAKIKKSKNKMMQVGNEREHQAIVREMDSLERSARARSEERSTLLEELQLANENLAEVEREYNEVKGDLDAKTATLEETLAAGKDVLAVLDKKRQQASRGIPKPIFMRYEFIRRRLEHPVIVPVDDGICSGCNIAIPPQAFIELQRGQQILSCPNCQRLIFWSQHFGLPETPRKKLPRPVGDVDDGGEPVEDGMDMAAPIDFSERDED